MLNDLSYLFIPGLGMKCPGRGMIKYTTHLLLPDKTDMHNVLYELFEISSLPVSDVNFCEPKFSCTFSMNQHSLVIISNIGKQGLTESGNKK
jgi:hypothetical protein